MLGAAAGVRRGCGACAEGVRSVCKGGAEGLRRGCGGGAERVRRGCGGGARLREREHARELGRLGGYVEGPLARLTRAGRPAVAVAGVMAAGGREQGRVAGQFGLGLGSSSSSWGLGLG